MITSRLQCVAAFLLAIGIPQDSRAGDDYRCTIERFYQAQEETDPAYKALLSTFKGKQFTVDRASGITVGALKNSVDAKPHVIDQGRKDNSYKVVSAAGSTEILPGSILTALNVMEFIEGEKKPFNYMINDGVFFGTCEHF
jgi:hypothetical protein